MQCMYNMQIQYWAMSKDFSWTHRSAHNSVAPLLVCSKYVLFTMCNVQHKYKKALHTKCTIIFVWYHITINQCTYSWIFAAPSFCPCSVDCIFDCTHWCAHHMHYTICVLECIWGDIVHWQGRDQLYICTSICLQLLTSHILIAPHQGDNHFIISAVMMMTMTMQPPQYALCTMGNALFET